MSAAPSPPAIRLRGVRQNNLKNFDLDLPLGQLIVLTGPSGSGKSSLAFETLFAEGQRRYIETFSPYARQFFDRMDKPAVTSIEGIPPAIAIEQRNAVRSTRSTVGTMTELCDHVKQLWPHLARLHCRQCGRVVRRESPQDVWESLASRTIGTSPERLVTFDLPLSAKLSWSDSLSLVAKQGYQRLLLGGRIVRLEEATAEAGTFAATHQLTVIQDRLRLDSTQRARWTEALQQAYHFGKGKLAIWELNPEGQPVRSHPFSNLLHCAACNLDYREPSPALFSYNNPVGACPDCRGFGRVIQIDFNLAIPDRSRTLARGAVKPWQTGSSAECQQDLLKYCRIRRVPTDVPFKDLDPWQQDWVLQGDPDYGIDEAHQWPHAWYGVKGYFRWLETKSYKMHVRVLLARYRTYSSCPRCQGARFQPDTLLYILPSPWTSPTPVPARTGSGFTLADFYALSANDALLLVDALHRTRPFGTCDPLAFVLEEIRTRLAYLNEAGLGYLTLDRPTRTLSGGETERVNLTTCLGTRLVNTLYILDEPSVGLHPHDTDRLVRILQRLRDTGNTVVVVEHEAAIIRAADQMVDLGPASGENGGQITFQGTLEDAVRDPHSLTGAYLGGQRRIEIPPRRPSPSPTAIHLTHAKHHNLRDLTVSIPLERLVCITGVSGSGKTTLVRDVLLPALNERVRGLRPVPGHQDGTKEEPELDPIPEHGACNDSILTLGGAISTVVLVDQTPLARTPRSNPAGYVGALEDIREFFAAAPEAQAMGLVASDFSFNAPRGQCQRCRGVGFEKIEMQFLSDVFIRCPDCNGRRYRPHVLACKIKPPAEREQSCPTHLDKERGQSCPPVHPNVDPNPERGQSCPPLHPNADPKQDHGQSSPPPRNRLDDGWSVADFLEATVDDATSFLDRFPGSAPARRARSTLALLQEVGLGYLRLGQPLNTLSGGESQRIKLVMHLAWALPSTEPDEYDFDASGRALARILFLFDEPTTGLHFDDIRVLLSVFQRLVNAGHSVIVIEHNLDVIKCADWIIDLGPGAGVNGGQIVVCGTPETVAGCPASRTGQFLSEVLQPVPLSPYNPGASPHLTLRETAVRATSESHAIVVRGAREHNLKNLSVELPRNRFVVITGVSGSGKSTLAFDLLFNEGQRRFLDSMNAYARQFVEQMARPDVDQLTGLPPTVSIEQRTSRGGGKSTVATVTEIQQFLRLLFARLGTQHCPDCGGPVETQTHDALELRLLAETKQRGDLLLLAPVVRNRKGHHAEIAVMAARHGFKEIRADGKIHDTSKRLHLDRFREHTIEIVVGVFETTRVRRGRRVRPAATPPTATTSTPRALIEKALELGHGVLLALDNHGKVTVHSTERACPTCGRSFEPLDPKQFSYNSSQGWCPRCRGFGETFYMPENVDRGARADAIEESWFGWMEGKREPCPECHGARLNPVARSVRLGCLGQRPVQPDANPNPSTGGPSIDDFSSASVAQAYAWFRAVRTTGSARLIARDILPEIRERLKFLCEVGLDYLQLGRSVPTLSGGEAQRIRLAAQLGSNLSGVLYILDEPTIGLHARDNEQLLATLIALKNRGNSLIVVEHDEETMRRADFIIDLGPGAGVRGGEVVAAGTLPELLRHQDSITGQCLRAQSGKHYPTRGQRRPVPARPATSKRKPTAAAARQTTDPSVAWLQLEGASLHNLRNLTVAFPLNRFVAVTGVSGSGKSSLIRECLLPALSRALKAKKGTPAPSDGPRVHGWESLKAVYEVDQSPIGRTPRSTPATYVGFFDDIRALFAKTAEARMRGYGAGRFSFNSPLGRCPVCEGAGHIKLEMNFLPPAYVRCDACQGTRYDRDTLDITLHNLNISEVLNLSVEEALTVFQALPRVQRPLEALHDTGLDYLRLGQTSPTLSGGEAQRVKLVTHLLTGLKEGPERHIYRGTARRNFFILEEPTIGLHMSDVRRLVEVLQRLVDAGHSVLVIEHNLDLIAEADWVIDLGPEGGEGGGRLVAEGTPETIARNKHSHTGRFLRKFLPDA